MPTARYHLVRILVSFIVTGLCLSHGTSVRIWYNCHYFRSACRPSSWITLSPRLFSWKTSTIASTTSLFLCTLYTCDCFLNKSQQYLHFQMTYILEGILETKILLPMISSTLGTSLRDISISTEANRRGFWSNTEIYFHVNWFRRQFVNIFEQRQHNFAKWQH